MSEPPEPISSSQGATGTPEGRSETITYCPNCGTEVADRYCPHCGQESQKRVVSLRIMVEDAIGEYLTFDARLPQTLQPLLFEPGYLTREYISGRRERYTRPSRLYLAISVIFFFVLSFTSDGSISNFGDDVNTAAADTTAAQSDSLYARTGRMLRQTMPPPYRVDVEDDGIEIEADSSGAQLWLQRDPQQGIEETQQTQFLGAFVDNFPKLMFLMLPVFALLLKMLYIRRQRYYIGHLIFALHYHAFAFIILLVVTLSTALLPDALHGFINAGLTLWLLVYLFVAMRTVYAQSWWQTLIKYFVLLICYITVLSIGVAINAVFTAYQMGEL